MRTTAPKLAAASVGLVLVLAGCGSATRTTSPTTQRPASTAPATQPSTATTAPPSSVTVPSAGVLSQIEMTDLAFVSEEERVGRDIYQVFSTRFPSQPIFSNLVDSQTTQTTTVAAMLARYGVANPSSGTAGTYSDATLQRLYDSTVASGTTVDEALDAVEHFEGQNLTDLKTAASHTTRADLVTMYTNLEQASDAHLAACTDAAGHHS